MEVVCYWFENHCPLIIGDKTNDLAGCYPSVLSLSCHHYSLNYFIASTMLTFAFCGLRLVFSNLITSARSCTLTLHACIKLLYLFICSISRFCSVVNLLISSARYVLAIDYFLISINF